MGADAAMPKLVSLLGSDKPTLEAVLAALGWDRVAVAGEDKPDVWRRAIARPQAPAQAAGQTQRNDGNPASHSAEACDKAARASRKAGLRPSRRRSSLTRISPFAGLKALLAAD